MKMRWLYLMGVVSFLGLGNLCAGKNGETLPPLSSRDESTHAELIQRLSPGQVKAVSKRYPRFRLLKLCSGSFSGGKRQEVVLGVWNPVESEGSWKGEVHRIGLIWNRKSWDLHAIDEEIKNDADVSRSFPMKWAYRFDENGFSAGMKCGVESEFCEGSDLTYDLSDKPFFDLEKEGLSRNKPVCFATDHVYNNWDCAVYDQRLGRFRLWFQQAHAD